MTVLTTIKSLYAANGLVAVLLYLPQIYSVWQDKDKAASCSLVSFGGWSIGSLITALYAWLFVQDRMFTAVSLGNMAGSGTVFLIAAGSRLALRRNSAYPARKNAPIKSSAWHEADRAADLAEQLP